MIQETAQTAVGCMHGTKEAPALRCELAYRRGANFGENGTTMYRAKVRQVAHVVQLVRDDAEA